MLDDADINNFDQHISLEDADAVIAEQLSQQDSKYFLLEHLVIAFGFNIAGFLGYLINKHYYYKRTKQLVSHKTKGDGWFYFTIENASDELHLSRHEQDNCIKKLKDSGLIEVVTMGVPAKRYFRLCLVKIAKIFVDPDVCSSLRKSGKLACRKAATPDAEKRQTGHIYNKIEDKKENKDSAPPNGDAKKLSSSNSPMDKKTERSPGVFVTEPEHVKLISKFGEVMTTQGYEELSEWKASATPAQVNKHKSDYFRLRKWVIPQLIADANKFIPNVAKHRQGSKLATPGDRDEDNFRRRRL